MAKFSFSINNRRQQTAALSYGYWNKYCVEENTQECDEGETRETEGQVITDQQHRPAPTQTFCDHGESHTISDLRQDSVLGTEVGNANVKEEELNYQTDERITTGRKENLCIIHIKATEKEKCEKREEITEDETNVPEGGWGYVVGLGCFIHSESIDHLFYLLTLFI